jgi:hypothetical protein
VEPRLCDQPRDFLYAGDSKLSTDLLDRHCPIVGSLALAARSRSASVSCFIRRGPEASGVG